MNDDTLWGVFDPEDGLLLADNEAKCRALISQWCRIRPSGKYTTRQLTAAEIAEVQAWPNEELK